MPKTETIYTDDELGLSQGWDDQLDPNIRRELRQARIDRHELAELRAEVGGLRRVQSLASAGVPNDKRGEAFARIYDGSEDATEIRSAYEELFGQIEAPSGNEADTDAERRIVDATNAGTSQGGPGTRDFGEALKNAKTMDEWREVMRNAPPEAKIRLPED